jgi:hypothetical protein
MTAYSQTIRNNLWPFSNAGGISVWGDELWGGYWGYEPLKPAYDIYHVMEASGPVLSSAQGPFDVVHIMEADGPVLSSTKGPYDIYHVMEADGIVLSDLFAKSWSVVFRVDGLVLSSDPYEETLSDRNGYFYVFGTSRNAERRPLTAYTRASVSGVSWVSGNGATTVWS